MTPSRNSGRAPRSSPVALLALATLSAWGNAQARVYATPVIVRGEEDLRALYEDGLLEDADFETLLELLNNPVDINRARRSDLYDLPGLTLDRVDALLAFRKENGPFANVDALAQVDGFNEDLLEQIRPFVEARPAKKLEIDEIPVRGRMKARTSLTLEPIEPLDEDDNPERTHTVEQLGYGPFPASYIGGEVEAWRWLEVGMLGLLKQDVRGVSYDPELRDLYVNYGVVGELGRIYAAAHRVRMDAVVGTYTAGFGLGLTFDRTQRSRPHGLYPDLSVSGTEDFDAPRRLFGAGVRGFNLPLGPLSVDGTAFVSSSRGDVYQYDMGMTGGEALDPYVEDLDSPRVYLDGQRVGYVTIPNAWREDLAGANLTLRLDDRTQLGFTGYAARQDRTLIAGMDEEYAFALRDGWPSEPTYGALGLNGTWGMGHVDLAAELAHSVGGGNGAMVQGVFSWPKTEVEATLRRYATDFDNPYARGQANADEHRGQRDQDEQGARVKVESRPIKQVGLRGSVDLWQNISAGVWNADLYGRAAWSPVRDLDVVLYAQHRNRNLAVNDRTRIYGGSYEDEYLGDSLGEDLTTDTTADEALDPVDRAGSRNDLGVQVDVDKVPRTSITAFYRRTYEDAGLLYPDDGGPCVPWFQIGQYTWMKVRYTPIDDTALTLRVRYRDDDIYGSLGDRQVESYLQVEQKLPKRVKVAVRGTIGRDLVDEASAWDESCEAGGSPVLDGTCVVDESALETEIVREKPYGALWASAELRF